MEEELLSSLNTRPVRNIRNEILLLCWLLIALVGLLDGLQHTWAQIAVIPIFGLFFVYAMVSGWRDYRWKWATAMASAVVLAFIVSRFT